ncbi:MAG: site-2 protease family protein [Clostridia bacterium]|nr:site-2 protease family protein [Clostridia bacterium]
MLRFLLGEGTFAQKMLILLIYILALTIAFSVHEFAHAVVAYKLGDNTPYYMGRVTLNPLAHIDKVGMVLLLLLGFGWGKPVVFNPSNISKLKNRRLGIIFVSAAGVTANFITALLANIIIVLLSAASVTNPVIYLFLDLLSTISISLLAFNLLPIPPLDGFNILRELLPLSLTYSNGFRAFVANAPRYFFLLILIENFTGISVLGRLMGLIAFPFEKLINLICYLISLPL